MVSLRCKIYLLARSTHFNSRSLNRYVLYYYQYQAFYLHFSSNLCTCLYMSSQQKPVQSQPNNVRTTLNNVNVVTLICWLWTGFSGWATHLLFLRTLLICVRRKKYTIQTPYILCCKVKPIVLINWSHKNFKSLYLKMIFSVIFHSTFSSCAKSINCVAMGMALTRAAN